MDSAAQDVDNLKQKVAQANLPPEVKDRLNNLLKFPGTGVEFERLTAYIELCLSLPFGKLSEDILDLSRAKEILDKNHYGLHQVKDRILEYLAVMILNRRNPERALRFHSGQVVGHAPILLFVGLVGTGKTSLAYSIAEALGRKVFRIPFGGLGNVAELRGTSRVRPEAETGQIIKVIKRAAVNNPVILLDEIDRVAEEDRVDIMGVLVELLDPAQNQSFVDHFLDFPYDLSQVLFIATANNTTNIATAVLDRMEPIQMPAYSDEEKIIIGKNYLLPKALEEVGIDKAQVIIEEAIWPSLIRPLGFDAGIRSLSRTLQGLSRKIARQIVEGQVGPFKITTDNMGEYLNG